MPGETPADSLRARYPAPLAEPEPPRLARPDGPDRRPLVAAAALGAAAPLVAGLAIVGGVPLLFSHQPVIPGPDHMWERFARAGVWTFGVAVGVASGVWFPLGLAVAVLAAAGVACGTIAVLAIVGGLGVREPSEAWAACAWVGRQAWALLVEAALPCAVGAGAVVLLAGVRRAATASRRRS